MVFRIQRNVQAQLFRLGSFKLKHPVQPQFKVHENVLRPYGISSHPFNTVRTPI